MSKTAYEQLAQAISSKASTLTETERNSLKALLDGFNQELQPSYPSYTVTVDYDKTVEQLTKDGKYDWKNDDITSDHFPSAEKGQVGVTIYLMNFNRNISSEDAIREMEAKDFRPATLKELLALGAAQQDLQIKDWIVVLGSIWRRPAGDANVPYLRSNEGNRRLSLLCWAGDWSWDWQFAAVRK